MLSLTLLFVASIFSGLNASPLGPYVSSLNHRDILSKRAITAAQLVDFQLFAQYSAAAYCPANTDAASLKTQIVCSAGNCPLVESDDAISTLEFSTDDSTDSTGFIAVDKTKSLIVLSMRGSETLRNYITDVLFVRDDTDICTGCSAHSGFLNAYKAINPIVTPAIKAALTANPKFRVAVTGHSLGGAIATLMGASLRNSGIPCDIITYGTPRVGDAELANYITAQAGITARITHLDDPVPNLPPLSWPFDYRHTSPEYWLSNGEADTVNYGVNDVLVCNGIANKDCNASEPGTDTEAHSYYFGDIGACSSGFTFK